MGDLVKLNTKLLRCPIAIAATKDERSRPAAVVGRPHGIDGHWGQAYGAVETVPLTSKSN